MPVIRLDGMAFRPTWVAAVFHPWLKVVVESQIFYTAIPVPFTHLLFTDSLLAEARQAHVDFRMPPPP
ncbi:MAG: hypothetical protein WBF93_04240 [Pirellulales bacterium]